MPVYEQKLICPLAVRFTQEHARTTFRDGRLVEDSFQEIQAVPGVEGYDLILQAPFPNIEIIRWSPHSEESGGCCQARRERGDCSHWLTLDNRRLYCLQRAAAEHWPRRVGVAVDILYAEPGRVWRKSDSTTCGKTVSIGHSSKGPELGRWDWLERVLSASLAVGPAVDAALEAVDKDDARNTVAALADAPGEPGSLMALVRSAEPLEELFKGCPTPSTATAASEDSDESVASEPPSADEALLRAVKRGLTGVWYGGEGETYTFRFGGETRWSCIRQGTDGAKTFTVTYDGEGGVVWWGTTGSYYFSASHVAEEPDELQMYAARDVQMRRPKFVWHRRGCGPAGVVDAPVPGAAARAAPGGGGRAAKAGGGVGAASGAGGSGAAASGTSEKDSRSGAGEGGRTAKAAAAAAAPAAAEAGEAQSTPCLCGLEVAAVAQIEQQLRDPSNGGYVRIPDWSARYAGELGSLRSFLQRRPERFAVAPGRGGRFTVSLVSAAVEQGGCGGGGRAARGRRPATGRGWAQRREA